MSIPKVFISYSHDSMNHKKWVLDLATRMRNNGIDAIIDQWELQLGDDLPHFMETHLAKSDKIIMICTEKYVKKANTGIGGVGYEKMIITSNLLKNIDENKIIPIVKQSTITKLPTFLKTKLYIDFSRSDDYEFCFDELIRTIHNSPLYKKPTVGNNPYAEINDKSISKTHDSMYEFMKVLIQEYNSTENSFIYSHKVKHGVKLSRLMWEHMVQQGLDARYFTLNSTNNFILTQVGKIYAINNKLA